MCDFSEHKISSVTEEREARRGGSDKLFGKVLAGPDIKALQKPEAEIQFLETES